MPESRRIRAALLLPEIRTTTAEVKPCPEGCDCRVCFLIAWHEETLELRQQLEGAVEEIERLREALREAIAWSYGDEVTPESRDELERLIDG